MSNLVERQMIISKPVLPGFFRTRLRRFGITSPYDFLDTLISSRKSGNDIADYYGAWDNTIDVESTLDMTKSSELNEAQETLRQTLSNFLDVCPMTSFLIHTEIREIEELPNGLLITYAADLGQMESTQSGFLPDGYIPGTFRAF